jgi:hypothetical protein
LGDYALRIIGVSTVLSGLAGVVAWIIANPYAALVAGLASWIAVAILMVVIMAKRGQSNVAVTSEPEVSSTQPTSQAPAELQQEIEAQNDSLPYPRPRPLPQGAQSRQHFPSFSFRLVDLVTPEQAMSQTAIRDKNFYKCVIHGPAVLAPMENTRFVGETEFFDEPRPGQPDSMFYELEANRKLEENQTRVWVTGVVGVQGCVFRDCTFVDIGVMAQASVIQQLKSHLDGNGEAHIT